MSDRLLYLTGLRGQPGRGGVEFMGSRDGWRCCVYVGWETWLGMCKKHGFKKAWRVIYEHAAQQIDYAIQEHDEEQREEAEHYGP